MDYKQKYQDALEKVKWLLKDQEMALHAREKLANIFPELSESEDEKIRKAILGLVKQSSEILGKQNQNNMIAWLEKSNPVWSEEDEQMILSIEQIMNCASLLNIVPEKIDNIKSWLKSLRPQNNITDEELAQAKKDAYNDALDKIEYHSGEPTFDDGWSAAIWYLKKKNAMPQTQWKPSDEQLEALKNVIHIKPFKNPSNIGRPSDFPMFTKNEEQCDKYIAWLEKQGEKATNINGEDYDIDGLYHAIKILEETVGKVTGYQSDDGILEHKAAINVVKKLYKKQGEKSINHTDIKEKAHQIAWETSKDYDPSLSKEAWCEMAALDMASWLKREVDDAYLQGICDAKHEIEKQGEQKQTWKPSEAQLIVIKELIEDKNTSKVHKTILRGMLNELEKQGKSTRTNVETPFDIEIPFGASDSKLQEVSYDIPEGFNAEIKDDMVVIKKVEPKFHPGDWIVDDETPNDVFCVIEVLEEIYKVIDIDGDDYHIPHCKADKQFHIWSITDAKDGDVLYSPWCKLLWIYKDEKTCHVGSNLNYNSDSIVINKPVCIPTDVQPATKEQRDMLFQKMKEAGHEWDNEKKELKKIEQKPVDNFEQKFHEGDLIVINETTYQIAEIDNSHVVLSLNGRECNFGLNVLDNAHFWTIEDAKDGDVLVDSYSKDSIIILYKGIYKERTILAHCGWNGYNLTVNTNGFGHGGLDNTNYLPATKEQRDLLFQKMKEAGYKWNAEKKELKKIEVKSENIEPKPLDANKVIEWLNDQACLGWIEDIEIDKFIDKFKKDFGL